MVEIKAWFLKCERYRWNGYGYQNEGNIWIDVTIIETLYNDTTWDNGKERQYIAIDINTKDNYRYRIYDIDIDTLLYAIKEANKC